MLMFNWLDYWRLADPGREALFDVASGRRYSYSDLAAESLGQVARLHSVGIRPGDRIAALIGNRPEMLTLLFACAREGAILVPLNYRLSAAEVAAVLDDAGPRLILSAPEHRDLLDRFVPPDNCEIVDIEQWQARHQEPVVTGYESDPESPVLILYTSGTTGKPKGVVQSQRMIGWNALNTALSWELTPGDCALVHTPFFHTGGLHVLTTPLLQRGGRLVLLAAFNAQAALSLVQQERISVLFAVPTMFRMLADSSSFHLTDFGSVRFCISGGAPCPLDLIERYQQRGLVFRQGYGLTEAGPNCLTLQAADSIRKMGSVGRANVFTRLRCVDERGEVVVAGGVGELQLAGPMLCSGYWQNPTENRLLFDGEWLKTGDLARFDDEGFCYIVDRRKDMYISGGENVYPAEVEAALQQHPAIREVAVLGVPDARWGEVGRAFVVIKEGEHGDEAQLLAFAARHLARYKLPRDIVFRSEPLPRTTTGKILKKLLKG